VSFYDNLYHRNLYHYQINELYGTSIEKKERKKVRRILFKKTFIGWTC